MTKEINNWIAAKIPQKEGSLAVITGSTEGIEYKRIKNLYFITLI